MVKKGILKDKYWSKGDAFLLPLTGLQKEGRYKVSSYLFWEEYSIEDYHLIIKMDYSDKEDFLAYCKKHIFPVLNRNAYLVEAHDIEGGTVYVLDISDWKTDIEWFLKGKYSKLSTAAKEMIKKYHSFYAKDDMGRINPIVEVYLMAALYPSEKRDDLGGKSPIEKIIKDLGLTGEQAEDFEKIGEAAGVYQRNNEDLNLKMEEDAKLAEKNE